MKIKITHEEVIQWLQKPEFESGIALLKKANPTIRISDNRALAAKLCFIAGIPFTLELEKKVITDKGLSGDKQKVNVSQPNPKITKSSNTQTPVFIEKIVREHARLVMLRSQLDEQRKKLPLTNDEVVVKARRTLTQSINQHSLKIELLYNAKEDYYTKAIIPNMVALGLEAVTDDKGPTGETGLTCVKGVTSDKKVTGDKGQAIDVADLKSVPTKPSSRLASLRAAQQRDQHLLDNHESPDTPMPDGPKRRSIVARMKKRMNEINKLVKGDGV